MNHGQFDDQIFQWLKKNSPFLGELVSCGYCFAYWVAFVLVTVYRPRLFFA